MPIFMLQLLTGAAISEIILILIIFAAIFIIFALGRFILYLVINGILGLIAIYILNSFFGLGIPINLPVIIACALFGLPAVLVIVILKLGGVTLLLLPKILPAA